MEHEKVRFALLALALSTLILIPQGALAADSPGCEGLSEFKSELFPIGEEWGKALAELGLPNRDIAAFSSDDWRNLADIALTYNRAFKELQPPNWLEEWLQIRIESTGLQEQIGKAAAEGGLFVILAFQDQATNLDNRENAAKTTAIERCPEFAQFAYDWDSFDGEVDGTPVPIPTPLTQDRTSAPVPWRGLEIVRVKPMVGCSQPSDIAIASTCNIMELDITMKLR